MCRALGWLRQPCPSRSRPSPCSRRTRNPNATTDEIYKEQTILYGLGNFIFQTRTPIGQYEAEVWQSVIADLRFEGKKLASLELIPIVIDEGEAGSDFLKRRGYPALAKGETARLILNQVVVRSIRHGTRIRVEGIRGAVVLNR